MANKVAIARSRAEGHCTESVPLRLRTDTRAIVPVAVPRPFRRPKVPHLDGDAAERRPPALPAATSDLAVRLRAGDEAAFEAVFRAYAPALVRCAHIETGSLADAEEIVQELFLGLWRRRDAWTVPRSLEAYLFAAVRNRVRNGRRDAFVEHRAQAAVLRDLTADGPALAPRQADDGVAQAELARAVRTALASLPPRAREVYALNREWHLPYRDIAARLGVTVKAVEATMTRALRALREALADWDSGQG